MCPAARGCTPQGRPDSHGSPVPRTAAEGISHFWLFRPRSPAVAQEHPPSVVSGPQRLAARLAERNRREEGGRKEALARIWLQLHSPAPWEMVRGVPCMALGTSHPGDVIWSLQAPGTRLRMLLQSPRCTSLVSPQAVSTHGCHPGRIQDTRGGARSRERDRPDPCLPLARPSTRRLPPKGPS